MRTLSDDRSAPSQARQPILRPCILNLGLFPKSLSSRFSPRSWLPPFLASLKTVRHRVSRGFFNYPPPTPHSPRDKTAQNSLHSVTRINQKPHVFSRTAPNHPDKTHQF